MLYSYMLHHFECANICNPMEEVKPDNETEFPYWNRIRPPF